MRFYRITITDPKSGLIWRPNLDGSGWNKSNSSVGDPWTFSSQVSSPSPLANGAYINNPGALNVEFDFSSVPFNTPQGNAVIRVWGLGLRMLSKVNFSGQHFRLEAGMMNGLPLATAAAYQAGTILDGTILAAIGNWEGVNQTLEFVVNAGPPIPPNGIVFSWNRGQPLAAAIFATLSQAFPSLKTKVQVTDMSPPYNSPQGGCYQTAAAFGQALIDLTKHQGAQITGNSEYPGVGFFIVGDTIYVTDDTVPFAPIHLHFQDLIGQPTWTGSSEISFKTVLRSDIGCGLRVKFPEGIVQPYALTSPVAATSQYVPASSQSAFQGSFTVKEVHHYASFRDPSASSWNTTFAVNPSFSSDDD